MRHVPTRISDSRQICDIPYPDSVLKTQPIIQQPITTFQEYIKTLPDWEKQLLSHFRDNHDMNMPLRQHLEKPGNSLLTGSDGGAIPAGIFKGMGSFGVIIGTTQKVFWYGHGPVYGEPINPSFRTEAVALLALCRFLLQFTLYYNIVIQEQTTKIYSDSKSLLDLLAQLETFENDWYPSVYRWNNIDVIIEIVKTLQLLRPLKLKRIFVKGHADKKKRWFEMTRPEQINVLCDTEANIGLTQQQFWTKDTSFRPLPSTYCYLQHNQRFMTSQEQDILRTARAATDLKDYYAKRHGWTKPTKASVDWDSTELALKLLDHDSFAVKLRSSWLPTQSKLKRREGISDKCVQCGNRETNDHIWVCPHRLGHHINFQHRLTSKLAHWKTDPRIIDEITTAINALQNDMVIPITSIAGLHQKHIGWHNLFRGFFARSWTMQQRQYIQSPPDRITFDENWASRVIALFMEEAYTLWSARNQHIHQKTARLENQQARRRAEAKIRHLYSKGQCLPSHDRKTILAIPLEEKLKESVPSLFQWHDNILPLIQRRLKYLKDNPHIPHPQSSISFSLVPVQVTKRLTHPRHHTKSTPTEPIVTPEDPPPIFEVDLHDTTNPLLPITVQQRQTLVEITTTRRIRRWKRRYNKSWQQYLDTEHPD